MPNDKRQRIITLLWESFIKISGWSSAFLVLLIVVFLFREGGSLFFHSPLEDDLAAAVHPQNTIRTLSDADFHRVVEGEITNWKALGGADVPIFNLNVNNIEKELKAQGIIRTRPEEALGENYERLAIVVDSFMQAKPGVLLIFQPRYLPATAQRLTLGSISLSSFVVGKAWEPAESPSPFFGALPLLWGTVLVTLGAILFALLLGPPVAIYLAELAPHWVRNWVKPMIELLAGIPSVVFGFIGLVVLVPTVRKVFDLESGSTALSGSLLLAIIALPTLISLSEDAIRAVPRTLKEASLALGATHWQTIWHVVIPYSTPGITAATILGVGRIVGETMAVLMVTGNSPQLVGLDFLESVRTMSAAIAAEMGEAPQGGLHYKGLFAVGCLLFILTFILNLVGEFIQRMKQR